MWVSTLLALFTYLSKRSEIKFDTDIAIYISSNKPEIFKFENIMSLLPFYFSGKDLI